MPNITKPTDVNTIWAATSDSVAAPSNEYILNGWESIIPPKEFFNWLDNRQDRFNAHVNQHGIPVWDATTEYQAGLSYVKGANGKIYLALTTNTNTNPLTAPVDTAWTDVNASNMVVFSTAGSFTWTVPAILRLGIKKAEAIVTAAGGSGGLGTGGGRGAGGGAGGTGIALVDLTGVTSVNIVVGVSTAGNNGTNSTFGTYITATGGVAATNGNVGSGGQGGTATSSGINLRGGSGSDAQNAANGGPGGSGDGGASYWGGGQRSGSQAGNVAAPPGFGAGAGGVPTSPRSIAGGGIVVIKW